MKLLVSVADGPDRGRTFRLDGAFDCGREGDLRVSDPALEPRHFRVEPAAGGPILRALAATRVNDELINGERTLRHGDRISAGATTLVVELEEIVSGDRTVQTEVARTILSDKTPRKVRCLRCGTRAPDERSTRDGGEIAYFCEACRGSILDEPVEVPGYELVRRLGAGGMGVVYHGRHLATGEDRALKVLLPRVALSEKARRLFVREATEQARLAHPRIVRVHELAEIRPGVFCMTMELVDGPSAAELLRASPAGLDTREAIRIATDGLEGLAHAHRLGVVHRDVKDGNLLVGKDGTKLSDFGLAKPYLDAGRSAFTRTGEVGGSVPYMAPEQIADYRAAGPPADLYSMGATLYRLLSGATPHDEVKGVDPLVAALLHPFVPLAQRKASLPAPLVALVERALAREPSARFASAEEMRAALLYFL